MQCARASCQEKWRLHWQKMSELVFGKSCIPLNDKQHHKHVRIADSVLSLHVGPIQKSYRHICGASLMLMDGLSSWRETTSWKSRSCFSRVEPYRVPSCLFRCDQLTSLDLCHCELKPSLCFSVLPDLRFLLLHRIYEHGGRVEAPTSPFFENSLTLYGIKGHAHLKLHAPQLNTVCVGKCLFWHHYMRWSLCKELVLSID